MVGSSREKSLGGIRRKRKRPKFAAEPEKQTCSSRNDPRSIRHTQTAVPAYKFHSKSFLFPYSCKIRQLYNARQIQLRIKFLETGGNMVITARALSLRTISRTGTPPYLEPTVTTTAWLMWRCFKNNVSLVSRLSPGDLWLQTHFTSIS